MPDQTPFSNDEVPPPGVDADDWAKAIAASLQDSSTKRPDKTQGVLPEVGETVDFKVIHNSGGGGDHCGLLALRDAARNTVGVPKRLMECLNQDPGAFRTTLFNQYMLADSDLQMSMACQYLPDADVSLPLSDDIHTRMERVLSTDKLYWDTLVWYVQTMGDVCPILWREGGDDKALVYQPDASCHQRGAMLHIVHYAHPFHYEALVPARADEVAQAVREADQVAQAISESSAAARVVKEDPVQAAREADLVAQAIRESSAGARAGR